MNRTLTHHAPAVHRPTTLPARALRRTVATALPPAVVLLGALLAWDLFVRLSGAKPYLVPSPQAVWQRWWGDLGFFYGEGLITVQEAVGGLALGGGLALLAAVVVAHSRALERGVLPVAIAVKVTPVVAVAPLFTIWFGFGALPKVLIAALITFFPLLVNAITGFRAVNPTALDLLRALDASPARIFLTLRLPTALPYIFAALKVSATLSLIGAMVAEWSGAGRGLGRVVLLAHSNLDMPTLFAGVFTLASLGVLLTGAISLIERRVLFWHEAFRSHE
jgi:ABC-type nitrate/sulfonate/bicarbonate transport system permease component